MVAVKANQAASFLKSIEPRIVAILVFGDDAGLVSERARLAANAFAARSKPPGEILRIEDADLDSDPDRLHTELRTVSMFGGDRVVRTSTSRKINAAFLKPLLEPGAMTGALVVEAGGLRPTRRCESCSRRTPRPPCHAIPTRPAIIEGVVREMPWPRWASISPRRPAILVSRLGADRALTRAEIEKLRSTPRQAYDHHRRCRSRRRRRLREAIDAIFCSATAAAMAATRSSNSTAPSPPARAHRPFIVMTLRHFQRLHRLARRAGRRAAPSTMSRAACARPCISRRARR